MNRLFESPCSQSARWLSLALLPCAVALGCGDGDTEGSGSGGQTTTTATSGESGGTGGGGSSGGTGGVGGSGGTTGGGGGSGGSTTGSGGGGGSEVTCTQERAEALGPIDMVSAGTVTVLDAAAGQVFIDASAGGVQVQKDNPWIYVALGTKTRVDVSDVSADSSTAWDLALKRPLLRSNSGDGGPAGGGGAIRIDKEFDAVTAADAQGVALATDDWFDDECNLATDASGAIKTAFDGWYDYENMTLLPHVGTWLVRGANGTSIFKLAILSYYSNPDGSQGMAGGKYLVRVATLVQ